jgi:hypothetical protein
VEFDLAVEADSATKGWRWLHGQSINEGPTELLRASGKGDQAGDGRRPVVAAASVDRFR